MQDWVYQWKISFTPDRSKQVQEVIFSRNINKIIHRALCFNNASVKLAHAQMYLGPQRDGKLSFNILTIKSVMQQKV